MSLNPVAIVQVNTPPLSIARYRDGVISPVARATPNGSILKPFTLGQDAVDSCVAASGGTTVYIIYTVTFADADDILVIPPGVTLVVIIGVAPTVVIDSITLPDGCSLVAQNVSFVTMVGGDNCVVRLVDSSAFDVTFGDNVIFSSAGTAQRGAGAGIDSVTLANVTVNSGELLVSNLAFITGSNIVGFTNAQFISCEMRGNLTATGIVLIDCSISIGVLTSGVGGIECKNVRFATVTPSVNNAIGTPFLLDGYSNYWLKINAIAVSHPAEKVITEDLVA